MTTPIIIETPVPPTRERLVLVPLHSVSREANDPSTEPFTVHTNDARDATPADLERAGYVMREPGDYYSQWAAERDRARKAESDLAEVRELQRSDERDGNVGFSLTCWVESILEQLNVARINRTELGKAAGQYARERDEQRDRAARAERELADLRPAPRGMTVREAARARHALGGPDAQMLEGALAMTERERDEAKEFARVLEVERDTLRAELARLTAPGEGSEGEPTDEELERAERAAEVFRAGVAHERARQQPAKDRATDEELAKIVYESSRSDGAKWEAVTFDSTRRQYLQMALAVAARVRQERCDGAGLRRLGGKPGESVEAFVTRLLSGGGFVQWGDGKREVGCLVAQAVGMGVSLEIGPHSKGVDIHVSRPRKDADGGEFFEGELVEAGRDDVPPSEASATLARLLGEVSRG